MHLLHSSGFLLCLRVCLFGTRTPLPLDLVLFQVCSRHYHKRIDITIKICKVMLFQTKSQLNFRQSTMAKHLPHTHTVCPLLARLQLTFVQLVHLVTGANKCRLHKHPSGQICASNVKQKPLQGSVLLGSSHMNSSSVLLILRRAQFHLFEAHLLSDELVLPIKAIPIKLFWPGV